MDLLFYPTEGTPFSMEVGYFDSVLEIKEKIEKNQGIPVAKQTLVFQGNVLNDELNIHTSEILDRSHINLVIVPDPEESFGSIPINPLKQIQLVLKMPESEVGGLLEMDINDSVRRIKERIQETKGIPVARLMIHSRGVQLNDHQTLLDCELVDHAEIDVIIRPSSCTTSSGSSRNVVSKKIKILVLTKCGTRKIPVEVSRFEKVGTLRRELEKLNQPLHLDLPEDGYFFIHKQNVLDDDRSFIWHHIGPGDTIEIFSGSISGGM